MLSLKNALSRNKICYLIAKITQERKPVLNLQWEDPYRNYGPNRDFELAEASALAFANQITVGFGKHYTGIVSSVGGWGMCGHMVESARVIHFRDGATISIPNPDESSLDPIPGDLIFIRFTPINDDEHQVAHFTGCMVETYWIQKDHFDLPKDVEL